MARILHVTDLHITGQHESLVQVWTGADAFLRREEKFDFVVVSGDLSQKADPGEYKDLKTFAIETLMKTLRVEEPKRVIFVPGNHDVNRKTRVHDPVRFAALTPDAIQKHVETLERSPAQGKLRQHLAKNGHFEMLQITDAVYRDRFQHVQAFVDDFYGGTLSTAGSRPFQLTSGPHGDWSCHHFQDELIAFVGLNSCRFTDEYWHGAAFEPASIAAALKHVDDLRAQMPAITVIAVWHHGFSSEVGRPDRLSLADLGDIYSVGARVGFHGHTHRDALEAKQFRHGSLVVIATGSIGAGNADLPQGMENQFSIVELFPTLARVQRIQRTSSTAQFAPAGAPRSLRLLSQEDAEDPVSTVRMHDRAWQIDDDGRATVEIHLSGLVAGGPMTVACLNPPFCHVLADKTANTDAGPIPVHESPLQPDGRIRFWAPDTRNRSWLRWSYQVSNAVALSSSELRLLPKRSDWFRIEPTEDIRSHTVRDECMEFRLSINFQPSTRLLGVRALVERRTGDLSDYPWQKDEDETARAQKALVHDESHATLSLLSPRVNHRYSLVYRPSPATSEYPDEASNLSRVLLERCRGKEPDAVDDDRSLRKVLTDALDAAIKAALACEGNPAPWIGFLWEHERRLLLPAFGTFRPSTWGARFASGNGVAGHCFRHSRGVAWSRGKPSVVYQERTEHGDPYSERYAYILCLPLVLGSDGPSLGVVSFARTGVSNPLDEQLRELAGKGTDLGAHPVWRQLRTRVTAAFWATVREYKPLTPELLALAKECSRKAEAEVLPR